MSYDLVQNSKPLQTIIYCHKKHGSYHYDDDDVARFVSETKTLDELKAVLVFMTMRRSGVLDEDAYEHAANIIGREDIPQLDSNRKWPWDEGYGDPT